MNPIRHLISIVFLFCGLTAWGSAKVYDRSDMVGTYKYEIPEYVLNKGTIAHIKMNRFVNFK